MKKIGNMAQGDMRRLARIRALTLFYILALAASGITAFPLLWETRLLCRWFGVGTPVGMRIPELACWLDYVHEGVAYNAAHYPFCAYGTDWLAFGHIVIAIFFIGVLIDPVRNIWIVRAGLIACALVPALAFACGSARGIPLFWRMVDTRFGAFGCIPLLILQRWIGKEATAS